MKIDRSRLKKSTSEVPIECQTLIEKLRSCSPAELLEELKRIDSWTFGKCELYHWIDILDICDGILEEAAMRVGENTWTLACDLPNNSELKDLLLWVLHFTTLLIEHSFSRHLYNSMERLVALLSSCDMHVVLGVLNLLYMFSKRSNFITRLDSDKRQALLSRLTHLAESWGGRDNGFGLADCCKDHPITHFPPSATTLHFEFYAEDPPAVSQPSTGGATAAPTATISGANPPTTSKPKGMSNPTSVIHIEHIDALEKTPAQIMDQLLTNYAVPKDKQMVLFTHLRLAHSFSNYQRRLQCVQARLQALSVLVYSNALADNSHSLLYPGLMEELVELLEIASPDLVEIRAAALRTLTSIIHLDRNPNFPHRKPGAKLNMIIDVTGAGSYHGFLPVLVRTCIASLTASSNQASSSSSIESPAFPLPLATALFSFLYHLASYEAGGEALVSCGMMESLLRVINWPGSELEHVTFVTRAVRVIDLITNIEMQAFQSHGGLTSFINRLEMEVNTCRLEQPFEIIPPGHQGHEMDEDARLVDVAQSPDLFEDHQMETESPPRREEEAPSSAANADAPAASSEQQSSEQKDRPNEAEEEQDSFPNFDYSAAKTGRTCLPQRAALLKSMLNFLKKAIQVEDPSFSDSIRRVMEGSLPSSLKHIISNAEYYGPSLFLLATDVVTVYVFQEPSLLSSLQDNGLTDVVLHALLVKEVPATREVLGSLPNMFSALCLNTRGLQAFQKCHPFPRIFKVLISPAYLAAMRRRRSSEPMGDTAASLGNAVDELMRHQPTLKQPAMAAIVKLLEELCALGRNPKYVCWRAQNKQEISPAATPNNQGNGSSSSNTEGTGSSDEEDEDEEEASSSSHQPQSTVESSAITSASASSCSAEKTPIALIDYIINVMKFVDAILSNNSTDDHCREFVNQNGLEPLLSVLGLPNLPVDYPVTTAAQSVSSVCKSILNLAHDQHVLQQGLLQLSDVLHTLRPLYTSRSMGGFSVLLQELVRAPSLESAFSSPSATPLLHAMTAAHGYVVMFVHVCRTGQADVRAISVRSWGSELGLAVLKALSELYVSLVWESTLLLALSSDDILPPGSDFGKEDMEKLRPASELDGSTSALGDMGSNGMTSAMEALSTTEQQPGSSMEVEGASGAAGPSRVSRGTTCCGTTPFQLKYIKPLLGASSRMGRALAELFGLLVKLCVGSPIRPRRTQPGPNAPAQPTPCARAVATSLNTLLARGLNYSMLPTTPIPKLRLTFLICSVGFTTPMLFDEKKYPYHLMLQNFAYSGGLDNFFETFRWALSGGYTIPLEEGLESPDLPEGTGEFLDTWLLLLEKMVNPRAILDSPHAINKVATSANKPFDPYQYLSNIHKMAFDAVMLMWGKKPLKTYGARMSESILAILRHILRGEKLMQEKQQKDEEAKKAEAGADGASGSGLSRRPGEPSVPQINQDHLRSLLDMGFSRELCEEALSQCTTLEQATDYLLNHPTPHSRSSSSAVPAIDAEMSEDDQMLRAIAISLGDTGLDPPPTAEKDQEMDPEPLSPKEIDNFTHLALPTCLALLDMLPDTVYRVCDLLVTITKRNGDQFRNELLDMMTNEISEKVSFLLNSIVSSRPCLEVANYLYGSTAALKAAVRIHLFTLLFEGPMMQEMRTPCALAVQRSGILVPLLTLLKEGSTVLVEAKELLGSTPKWLAPLLLMLDLLEKVALATQRKEAMHKVSTRLWRWYDPTSGRWTPYSSANNKIINDAYWSGEPLARISCGRRRYVIQFSSMLQVNEGSGNRRPVIMSMLDTYREEVRSRREELGMEMEIDDSIESDIPAANNELESKRNTPIQNLSFDDCASIIRACVQLLSIPVDRDALHAAMRVCLRLTRDFKLASIFADLGGVRMLLDLTQNSTFNGFLQLCTLIIRHVMEEPTTLSLAMEKVLRTMTQPTIPATCKELMYMFRMCSSAVCRHPEVFKTTAERLLRVDISLHKPRYDVEDTRLLLKCLPTGPHTPVPMHEKVSQSVIYDLLNALAREPVKREENNTTPCAPISLLQDEQQQTDSIAQPNVLAPDVEGNISAATQYNAGSATAAAQLFVPRDIPQDLLAEGAVTVANPSPGAIVPTNGEDAKKIKDDPLNFSPQQEEEKRLPLLPKSSILRLLAEAVRSYAPCAKLITDHHYVQGQSELITEDCSALAFLLDNLLPANENKADRECPNMVRMLVAALSSCTHSYTAQTTLVMEVKNALARTLQMPESVEKSSQIQALSVLISTMIENCPPSTTTPHSNTAQNPLGLRAQQINGVNNMVRIMLRRGLVTDLARVVHSLDLSSPNTASTVNAALKPLETLSRIMAQPSPGASALLKLARSKIQSAEVDPLALPGTPTSGATHAQGEDTAEDPDNTDHDVSGATESMEPNSESRQQQEGDEPCLDDLMDVLVSRERQGSTSSAFVNQTEAMDVESRDEELLSSCHRNNMFTEQEDHIDDESSDSGSNQSAEGEDQGDNENEESSSSSSSSSGSGDDDEDDEDEDDDDDDGDNADDVQQNGDDGVYEADNLELFPSDENVLRIPGLDRDNEDILMIQYSDPDPSGSLVPWNTNTFPLPFGIFEDANNGNENAAGGLNPGAHIHPLLNTRHSNESNNLSNTRGQRANRPRRYQYLQLNMRNTNPPVILQRLLGPLTGTLPLAAAAGQALANSVRDSRVVLMDHGLGILTNAEEEQIDFVDQSGYFLGPSLAAVTMGNMSNNTPTALNWWNEESKLLDGECSADLVFVVAHGLVGILKKYRDEELHERQQKLKKQVEEDERLQKKCDELARKKRTSKGETEPGKEQGMEVQSIPATPDHPGADLPQFIPDSVPEVIPTSEQNATNCMLESFANYLPPGASTSNEQASQATPEELAVAGNSTFVANLPTPEWGAVPSIAAELVASESPISPPADVNVQLAETAKEEIPDTPASPDETPLLLPSAPVEPSPTPNEEAATSNNETKAEAGETAPSAEVVPSTSDASLTVDTAAVRAAEVGTVESVVTGTTAQPVEENRIAGEALAAAVALAEAAGPSTSGQPDINVPELPEGVDPSFLAALPEDMREEVIAEQLRLQRIRQQTLETQAAGGGTGITQVNPEFLAALPPAIQEEVLSQQRLEQQRHAAASANPEDPVDAAAFFQNLQPALRQAILADMEDSQISALPPDLAAEAQNLRREWESRNRHMQDRFFTTHQGPSTLSQILRSHQAAPGSRRPVARYAIQTVPQQSRWMTGNWTDRDQAALALSSGSSTNLRARGRPLLDHEALTCLLVLLFLDEPRLNTGRLHRVFRNLCYHYQTRDWIIKALLSILERSNESRVAEILPAPSTSETPAKSKRTTRASQAKQATDASKGGSSSGVIGNSGSVNVRLTGGTSWLNVSVDAALGCRANIFHIQRPPSGKRGYERNSTSTAIAVHRQAAPIVCRHSLDLLISLAKSFPSYFLPARPKEQDAPPERVGVETRSRASSSHGATSSSSAGEGTSSGPSTSSALPSATSASTTVQNEFWELLLRLDSASSSRKGKNLSRSNSSAGVERSNESDSAHPTSFEASAFGQLLPMLDCEVVRRSTVLTDKLLRLLSLVSLGLSEPNPSAPPMAENQVRLAVQVLTSKSCSEEGLEDTTALLLNLASYSDAMREMILRLLLEGAMKLAYTVQEHIAALIGELSTLNQKRLREDHTSSEESSSARQERGLLHDRFTNDTVVVTAPTKLKGGMDLQLPSMAPLTSKTSSQAFFLRMLKVIIQLREAVRLASKKKTSRFDKSVISHSTPLSAPTAPRPAQAMPSDAAAPPVERMDTDAPNSASVPPSDAQPSVSPSPAESQIAQPQSSDSNPNETHPSDAPPPSASQPSLPQPSESQPPSDTPRMTRGRGTRHRAGRRVQQSAASPVPPHSQGQPEPVAVGVAEEGDAMDTSSPPEAPPDFEHPLPPEYRSTFHFINRPRQPPPHQDDDLDYSEDEEDDGDEEDEETEAEEQPSLPNLSEQLRLDGLWETLSTCLLQLADTPDHHAVLMLQPAVEAFFLVHAPPPSDRERERERSSSSTNRANPAVDIVPEVPAPNLTSQAQPQAPGQAASNGGASSTANTSGEEATSASMALENAPPAPALSPDQQKFLKFAETHRTVLNQILRQSTAPLADGPFAGLVDHVRILDFDVKRRYFRTELDRLDQGLRREELAVHVRRSNVFEDSFRELQRRPVEEWKNRFYIVFEGEEGQDAGGLLREWYVIISREIFNPMYALFTTSPGDRVTYMINSSSHCNPNHLCYFKFVGRVIAKAIYDNKLLECYFTRSFYKHILGISVKYTDMESEDYSFYQGLVFLMENHVSALGYDLTFSAEVQEFGVTEVRDLIPNGRNIPVTEENKMDYIRLVCQMKMTGAIRKQLNAFLEGFYDIIPKRLISIFNEQELELLISGLPNVDIEDLKANTEYHKYQPTSLQIQWFWRALRSLDHADRAKFLQFVTGTSKVPLQGFGALEGMNGVQKFQIHRDDRSTDRLPSAHTCFNQLDLPVYETYDKLRTNLLKAIHECSEGFGFA